MSGIFICGLGAVSPAGWGVRALTSALKTPRPIRSQNLAPGGRNRELRARVVPPPSAKPGFSSHARLRRSSPITQYAASSALEALQSLRDKGAFPEKLGLICCFQSGCVQYTCRFYEETLRDPAQASPLVFPETVFAAPTSHVAALLGNVSVASSLLGDPATYLQGVALAADWLKRGLADICLVVGAEEPHWLLADALWHFQHRATFASGAGTLALCSDAKLSIGAELRLITNAHTYTSSTSRRVAALKMREELEPGGPHDLLLDGLDSSPRTDAAERAAWRNWGGPRLSSKSVLGEGLMASAAWQCVAACNAVALGEAPSAVVSLVGCNQQAIGARFCSQPTYKTR